MDAETGLNYNMARDYDPAVGRYVESDPLGLSGGGPNTYAYVNDSPIRLSDPSGLLVRSDGWSNDEWRDIENAAAKIKAEFAKGCSCTAKGGMGSCVPCNLIPALQNSLDTMIVAYAPLLVLDGNALVPQCGFTPPVEPPRGLFLSRVPWGKVASTLYHELLHTTGLVFDVPNGNVPPAADFERACIGDLCKKGSR